jgi:hypothetical protein
MTELKSYSVGLLSALGLIALAGPSAFGQSKDSVDAHVAAARVAAGREHTAVFDNLCAAPAPTPAPQQAQRRDSSVSSSPSRSAASRTYYEPRRCEGYEDLRR